MAPLLKELSTLEIEPLEIVVHAPEPEQDNNPDTLTVTLNDLEVAALLMGTVPVNGNPCDLPPCCAAPYAVVSELNIIALAAKHEGVTSHLET
jgi:hypothetical protein